LLNYIFVSNTPINKINYNKKNTEVKRVKKHLLGVIWLVNIKKGYLQSTLFQ
jgi:hypothetical protein